MVTVSMGRLTSLKDHFVVAWIVTMVVKNGLLEFLRAGAVPRRHDLPELRRL